VILSLSATRMSDATVSTGILYVHFVDQKIVAARIWSDKELTYSSPVKINLHELVEKELSNGNNGKAHSLNQEKS